MEQTPQPADTPDPEPAAPQPLPPPGGHPGLWKSCLTGGLVLWVLTAAVTYYTENTTLLPTLILLGSFLVPGCFVLWAYEKHASDLGLGLIVGCFAIGGVLGVLGASVLEYYFLNPSVWLFVGVGLIEEGVKLGALIYMIRKKPHLRGLRVGMMLGASVGFGFAAVESAGYAFNATITLQGLDLHALLGTEVLRGLLAPFGHGLWTAIAGGVLLKFREADGRFRFTSPVITAYLGVAALHALWDSMHGIAIWLTCRLTGDGLQRALFSYGYVPHPTDAQQHLYTVFSNCGLLLVSLIGVGWLMMLVGRERVEQAEQAEQAGQAEQAEQGE
ncbi:PrsW family intramembrane metalloprotease [Streptomyces fractus]|uniref:PrsW family intramembrane metalloprotease n=1 Tax=Streptomyces fractus TaxID=641806 RepID=UPI003CF8A688